MSLLHKLLQKKYFIHVTLIQATKTFPFFKIKKLLQL